MNFSQDMKLQISSHYDYQMSSSRGNNTSNNHNHRHYDYYQDHCNNNTTPTSRRTSNNNSKCTMMKFQWCCAYDDPTLLMNYDDWDDDEYDIEQEVLMTERLSMNNIDDNDNENDNDNIVAPYTSSLSTCSPDNKNHNHTDNNNNASTRHLYGTRGNQNEVFRKGKTAQQVVVSFEKPPVTSVKSRPKTDDDDIDRLFYSELDIERFTRDCHKEENLAAILKRTLIISQSSSILGQGGRSYEFANGFGSAATSGSASVNGTSSPIWHALACKETLETEPLSECQSLVEARTFETALGEHDDDDAATTLEQIGFPMTDRGLVEEHDIYFDANEG